MPASSDALSILLLCDDRASHAPNVLEHIRAFPRLFAASLRPLQPTGHRAQSLPPPRRLRRRRRALHGLRSISSEWFLEQIAAFDGLKVQFIQDEYRRVDAAAAQMRELGIDLLFSSVPADAVPSVYGSRLPGVDILPTLTGYVPADLDGGTRPSLEGRPAGRRLPRAEHPVLARAPRPGQGCDRAPVPRARRLDRPPLRHRLDGGRPDLRRRVVPLSRLLTVRRSAPRAVPRSWTSTARCRSEPTRTSRPIPERRSTRWSARSSRPSRATRSSRRSHRGCSRRPRSAPRWSTSRAATRT